MAVGKSQYLPSVAEVILEDTTNDLIILRGKTIINNALKQSMSSVETRGGYGNGLLYLYQHSKKLDVTIEQAAWDEIYLAVNNNAPIVNGSQDFYTVDEAVTLTSGSGVLTNAPVGNIYVVAETGGVYQTITPSGSNFTVSGGGNTTVLVTYRSSQTVDSITIDAGKAAGTYKLTLSAKLFDQNGQVGIVQFTIPKFQLSGNTEVAFTAQGVSSAKLDGMALTNANDNSLGTISILPVGNTAITFVDIAAVPSTVAISSGTPTSQLTVYGIRSGGYANVVITAASAGTTYVSGTPATCTVSSGGLITRVASGSSVITVTNGSHTDTVTVTAT